MSFGTPPQRAMALRMLYEGLQKDASDFYVDALKKAGIYYDGTAEDVNSSYRE